MQGRASGLQPTSVTLDAGGVTLQGDLTVPDRPRGAVIFAHGSGSSRHSSRNRLVASTLQHAGLATLLFDLLTEDEEEAERLTRHLRFDIDLLARRLIAASDWLRKQPGLERLPIGWFGASTGGGAALVAAAQRPDLGQAVVSRGGRPDLAGPALPRVRAASLLVVGGADTDVLALNRMALAQMRCERELVVVPGATHLFEEPGTLEQVARLAAQWFSRHLAKPQGATAPRI